MQRQGGQKRPHKIPFSKKASQTIQCGINRKLLKTDVRPPVTKEKQICEREQEILEMLARIMVKKHARRGKITPFIVP